MRLFSHMREIPQAFGHPGAVCENRRGIGVKSRFLPRGDGLIVGLAPLPVHPSKGLLATRRLMLGGRAGCRDLL